jgi:glycosyltransferase involved in cell wall biosynthesis
MIAPPIAVLWGKGDGFLQRRTLRCLSRIGLAVEEITTPDLQVLSAIFKRHHQPLILLRAGTWLQTSIPLKPLAPSSTGMGLCAISPTASEQGWLHSLTAGLQPMSAATRDLGLPSAIYLDLKACEELLLCEMEQSQEPKKLVDLLQERCGHLRIVLWPGVTARLSSHLRVLQIVTSLQRGGAERMALDLTRELTKKGVTVRLATTGQPGRTPFSAPPEYLDMARLKAVNESHLDALLRMAPDFDLLHFHLLSGEEMARFSPLGIPTVCTVHNSQPGWPRNLVSAGAGNVDLLAACSTVVEDELRAAGSSSSVRTVWNGIELGRFDPGTCRPTSVAGWRKKWGFASQDLVLLAIANPRPQKRLHLLPGVLARARAKLGGGGRAVRLVFAGESSPGNPEAVESERLVRAEVERLELAEHVRWTGSVENVPTLLAAANVLVSASAYEGLSLTHLEALAMGVPVVCTATAGTFETSFKNPCMTVLPLDATPEAFAEAVAQAVTQDTKSGRACVARNFSAERMAERYLWFYKVLLCRTPQPKRSGLWLITNNFSMGGAQTSARRLLMGLASRGINVRAAVIQEDPDQPTPGRAALMEAGVPVQAFGPHGTLALEDLPLQLLEAIQQDPPEAVVFWNLITGYKVLLADALLDTPVFDVSPGEMYFSALKEYFELGRPGSPYLCAPDYGKRLAGVIVKYRGEVEDAKALGVPVYVIPNGTPVTPPVGRPDSAILRIGTAARVHPQKRLEDLIAALQLARPHLPPFELLIAGRVEPGCEEYFAQLQSACQDLPVQWLGELPETGDFLKDLDIFAMISEPAGCPNALLEALGAGLAVVATDVGGAREQVIDEVTGLLVPPREPKRFADALVRLAQDRAMRRKLGANAFEHIRKHFSLERMLDRYQAVCLPKAPASTTSHLLTGIDKPAQV